MKNNRLRLPPLQRRLLLKLPAVITFLFRAAFLCFGQRFLSEMLSNSMTPCTCCSAAGWALLRVPSLQRRSFPLSLEAFLSCLPHHGDVWLPDCVLSSLGIEPAPLGIISGTMEFICRRPQRAERVSSNKTRVVSYENCFLPWRYVIPGECSVFFFSWNSCRI